MIGQFDTESDANFLDDRDSESEQTDSDQAEVKKFLAEAKLADFWEDFRNAGADDMETLLELTDEDVKSLGLAVGHAAKLRRAIKKWESSTTAKNEVAREEKQALDEERRLLEREKEEFKAMQAALAEERRKLEQAKEALSTAKQAVHSTDATEVDPDLQKFLADAGLQQYKDTFAQQGLVRLDIVLSLESHHMKEIGMVVGHILMLQKAIAKKQQELAEAEEQRKMAEKLQEEEAQKRKQEPRRRYEALPQAEKDRLGNLLLEASKNGSAQEVERLVSEVGVNVSFADHSKSASLHWAADKGHRNVAEILVKAGAELEAVTSIGFTPLLCAVRCGSLDVVKYLLNEAGSAVNAKDNQGQSLLDSVCVYRGSQHKMAIEQLLRDAGAR